MNHTTGQTDARLKLASLFDSDWNKVDDLEKAWAVNYNDNFLGRFGH